MIKRFTIITFGISKFNKVHCVVRSVVCTTKKICEISEELTKQCMQHKLSYRIFRKDKCLFYSDHLRITSYNIHNK